MAAEAALGVSRVLILGGTGEAHRLAEAASRHPELLVTTSLAGRSRRPRLPPGRVRIGGFGGSEGLRAHLLRSGTDAVVDATHPFATRISAHAREACAVACCPLLVLDRPPWPDVTLRQAVAVRDLAEALAEAMRAPGKVLLTFAPDDPAALDGVAGSRLVVRSLTVPKDLPRGASWTAFAGTATAGGERRLFERLGVGALIAKASGGPATVAKLEAAAALGIRVVLVGRPEPPAGPTVPDLDAAVAWMLRQGGAKTDAAEPRLDVTAAL